MMTNRSKRLAIGMAMAFVCGVAIGAADQAVVRKPGDVPLEVGQALIAHSGKRCIALLPTHVVKEAAAPSLRYIGTDHARLGNLVGVQSLGNDLSMGTIVGGITRDCGHTLGSFSRAVDARLSRSTQGALRFVNGDGSLGFEPVVWLDDDRDQFIRIQPTSPGGALRKGMSGSLVMSPDNTAIGMLLSVNTGSGVGKVMRIDRILERAEQSLAQKRRKSERDSIKVTARSGQSNDRHSDGTLTLIAWSAPATSAKNRPENLLSESSSSQPWVTSAVDGPVSLDFGVVTGATITGLVLDAAAVDPSLRPRAAEVVLGNDDQFSYARSVWGGTLNFSDEDDQVKIDLAPTRARIIRVKLYPRQTARLSLRHIRAIR